MKKRRIKIYNQIEEAVLIGNINPCGSLKKLDFPRVTTLIVVVNKF